MFRLPEFDEADRAALQRVFAPTFQSVARGGVWLLAGTIALFWSALAVALAWNLFEFVAG